MSELPLYINTAFPTYEHRHAMATDQSNAVDEAFGEFVEIWGMIQEPNWPQRPDSKRPPYRTVAVFRAPAGPIALDRDLGAKGLAVVQTKPHFNIAVVNLKYGLREGDIITRSNGLQYEAKAPEKNDLGTRVLVAVTQLGRDPGAVAQ